MRKSSPPHGLSPSKFIQCIAPSFPWTPNTTMAAAMAPRADQSDRTLTWSNSARPGSKQSTSLDAHVSRQRLLRSWRLGRSLRHNRAQGRSPQARWTRRAANALHSNQLSIVTPNDVDCRLNWNAVPIQPPLELGLATNSSQRNPDSSCGNRLAPPPPPLQIHPTHCPEFPLDL